MESEPKRLDRLEAALQALPPEWDAMVLSELDGFIAGVLASPVEIRPEDWVPLIWNMPPDDGDAPPVDDTIADLIGRILDHHRRTSLRLQAFDGSYQPIFYEDTDRSTLWQAWASGFGEAMQINLPSWDAYRESGDTVVVAALSELSECVRLALDDSLPAPAEDGAESTAAVAAEGIPIWVETLFDWRLGYRPEPAHQPIRSQKIGRNDPCPCGSGKKYKKCCAAAA